MVFFKRNFVLSFINDLVIDHPTPINISYLWNFGSLAAFALLVQILTGIFLAMHYVPNIDHAFLSVEHIMREVNGGWLLRYLHANGASFFFIFVYIHMFRGLYYGSYYGVNRETWFIGVTIYILMMATAFLGYVLPWGQMSFWGATVITNFFSVFPFIGNEIVEWLWGGFSVNNATLNRFYSLHFFLPFLILALVFLHLVALHNAQHTNPLGLNSLKQFKADLIAEVSFFPYFIVKDAVGVITFLLFLVVIITFFPNIFGHPDNYIPANALSTPTHIVPEWYFLPFYAILRSVPNKILGVIVMFSSILILYTLPFIGSGIINTNLFKRLFKFVFWMFLVNCFILGWIGGSPVEYPFYEIGQVATCNYFIYFVVVMPLFAIWDRIGRKRFYRRTSVYTKFVNSLKLDGSIVWPNIANTFLDRWKMKGRYRTVKWAIRHIFYVFAEAYRFFKNIGFNRELIRSEYSRFLKTQKNFDALAFSCYFGDDDLVLRQLFIDSERFPGVYYAYKVLIVYEFFETAFGAKLKYFYSLYYNNPYLVSFYIGFKTFYDFIVSIIESDYYQIITIVSFIGFAMLIQLIPTVIILDNWFRFIIFVWAGIHTFFASLTIIKDYVGNQKIVFIVMQLYIILYIGFVWTYYF